ncbi:MAG TPA: hypothetical protein VF789_20620 [Thermoanaerobaculia bacterium]
MPREKTYNGVLGRWERLNQMMEVNKDDLPTLELSRQEFAKVLVRAKEVAQRQAVHIAGKQDASKELKTLITEGERMATMLQQGLKTRYGVRSEKLAEYGIQPFRGRPRKPEPDSEEPPSAPKPEEPAPTTT